MRLVQSVKEKIMRNGLPEGYTRLEYLQSTGVQYIDTGYKPTVDTETEVFFDNYQFSRIEYFFGCFSTDYRTNCYHAGCYQNDIRVFVNGSPELSSYVGNYVASGGTTGLPFPTSLQSIKITKSNVVVNGTTYTYTQNPNTPINVTHNMLLFGASDSGSFRSDRGFNGKIKCCRIKNGNVLVRDFIPALDPSNKPCMYDLVSKQPFYNQGTGADFSIGKKIIPVEYIESTGTQYIDTGINADSNLGIETLAQLPATTNDQYMGALKQDGSSYLRHHFTISSTGIYGYHLYQTRYDFTKDTNKHYIAYNAQEHKLTFDDTVQNTSPDSFDTGLNYWLFKLNNNASLTFNFVIRLFYFKMYSSGVLVRDFIPVRDENNVGYMLDLLTNTLYANAGTGAFAIGEDDLVIRNIGKTKFFKQTTRKVPKGFQEVEYLESTGTQYIDTGINPTQLTKATITAQFTDVNYKQSVLGSNDGSFGDTGWNNLLGTNENNSPNKPTVFWCQWGNVNDGPVTKDTNRHTHTFERNGNSSWTYTVDNTSKTITSGILTQTSPRIMYLFACNNNGTLYRQAKVKVYRCQIWNNDILVRDFVPYLDANGRPCMWDMVEGKAYYNQGTDEFSYGRKIIPVEYLESSGTQYIDTGFKGKNNLHYKTKVNFTALSTSGSNGIGGEYLGNAAAYIGMVRANGHFTYLFNNTAVETTTTFYTNTDYVIDSTMNSGNQVVKVNGETISTGTLSGTFTSTRNIFLYAICSTNKAADVYGSLKMYYCQIYDNDALVRDFIPCIDENNNPYMFDKVTHSAFLNQGTGQFSYGDTIKERTETLRVLPIIRHLPLNYLEATGTQYINTGLLSTASSKVDSTFSFTTMESGAANNCAIFGGRNNSTTNTFTFFKIASQTPQYFRFDYNSQPIVGTATEMTWNTSSKYRFQYNGTSCITTNTTTGESVTTTREPGSTFTTSSICLFAVNTSGTISTFMSGRIYHYWYTDGTNTIDLYPVLKLPERIPCMYDRVSKTYFYNESTDPFLYG